MTAFSQTDTQSNDSTLHIPVHIARQIVRDLLLYDGCKEELKTTQQLLALAKAKSETQSLLLTEKDNQYIMCREQVNALDQKVQIYTTTNKQLAAKNAKLSRTNKVLGTTTGVSLALAVVLILIR